MNNDCTFLWPVKVSDIYVTSLYGLLYGVSNGETVYMEFYMDWVIFNFLPNLTVTR